MRHKISLIVAILAVVGTVAAGVTGEYSFETKAPQIADKSGKHSTPLVLAREDMWSPKGGIVFPKEKDGLRLPEKAFNMPRGSFSVRPIRRISSVGFTFSRNAFSSAARISPRLFVSGRNRTVPPA